MKANTSLKKNYLAADAGAAAIEAVLIIPFLCLLYFGLQDLTALITFNRQLNQTSATISDTIAQYQSTVNRPQIADIFTTIGMIMQPTAANNVNVNVYDYYMNGSTVTQRWKVTSGGAPTCTAPNTNNLPSLMTAGNDIVVAVACMTYTPYVASFLGQNILGATSFNLNQVSMTRPYSSTTLNCVTTPGGSTVCTN